MTTKRIIIILLIAAGLYFCFVIGKLLLLVHYRQKADIAQFLSGDYKTAIEYYDKIINWYPDGAGNYYNRGDALEKDGQYEKAISDYKKALELGGTEPAQTILRIALAAKRQGDLETEELYLLKLHELSKDYQKYSPDFWAANYHLGQLEFKKKNYRKAVDYYTAAHDAWPGQDPIYHRANAYFALGKLDSASKDLRQSLPSIKANYLRHNPNSNFAKCDTCTFPFGSKEYELVTEYNEQTIIQILDNDSSDKRSIELNDKLKRIEKNNR